jgi:hypothetical protein
MICPFRWHRLLSSIAVMIAILEVFEAIVELVWDMKIRKPKNAIKITVFIEILSFFQEKIYLGL